MAYGSYDDPHNRIRTMSRQRALSISFDRSRAVSGLYFGSRAVSGLYVGCGFYGFRYAG